MVSYVHTVFCCRVWIVPPFLSLASDLETSKTRSQIIIQTSSSYCIVHSVDSCSAGTDPWAHHQFLIVAWASVFQTASSNRCGLNSWHFIPIPWIQRSLPCAELGLRTLEKAVVAHSISFCQVSQWALIKRWSWTHKALEDWLADLSGRLGRIKIVHVLFLYARNKFY